jgi:hypothetical protein
VSPSNHPKFFSVRLITLESLLLCPLIAQSTEKVFVSHFPYLRQAPQSGTTYANSAMQGSWGGGVTQYQKTANAP